MLDDNPPFKLNLQKKMEVSIKWLPMKIKIIYRIREKML